MRIGVAICLGAQLVAGCQVARRAATTGASDMWVHSEIETSLLRPGYRLARVAQGLIGQPVIASLVPAVLDEGGVVAVVQRFADLAAFVGPIERTEDALALARLYTGYPDAVMFEDRVFEIDEHTTFLRMPAALRKMLLPPQVELTADGGFRLARDLAQYEPEHTALRVFRSEEMIDRSGGYRLRIARVYPTGGMDVQLHLPE